MSIEEFIKLYHQYQKSRFYNLKTDLGSFVAYLESIYWEQS